MIPELIFPPEKIQLDLLFKDELELEKSRQASEAKSSLSKVSAAYHELYFPAPSEERPYTFASMVLSLDGKMAFQDNPEGPVVASANYIDREGGLVDFWVLNVLRAHADAIIIGAKMLQSEPEVVYACFDPDLLPERKVKLRKEKQHPLGIIVSLDGTDIPVGHSLFSVEETQTIMATCSKGGQFLRDQYGDDVLLVGPYHTQATVDSHWISQQIQAGAEGGKKVVLMTGTDVPDAKVLLYILRKIGIRHLLVESPTYTWLLMNQQMLDEFFVNYSSLYIGGTITPGYGLGFSYLDHPHAKFLVIAMHRNSFIYTRQKLIYGLSTEK